MLSSVILRFRCFSLWKRSFGSSLRQVFLRPTLSRPWQANSNPRLLAAIGQILGISTGEVEEFFKREKGKMKSEKGKLNKNPLRPPRFGVKKIGLSGYPKELTVSCYFFGEAAPAGGSDSVSGVARYVTLLSIVSTG